MLAAMFMVIEPSAGWPRGTSGKQAREQRRQQRARASRKPARSPIFINAQPQAHHPGKAKRATSKSRLGGIEADLHEQGAPKCPAGRPSYEEVTNRAAGKAGLIELPNGEAEGPETNPRTCR
jgi:hypothetical protein